jgi:hypothetical protein
MTVTQIEPSAAIRRLLVQCCRTRYMLNRLPARPVMRLAVEQH